MEQGINYYKSLIARTKNFIQEEKKNIEYYKAIIENIKKFGHILSDSDIGKTFVTNWGQKICIVKKCNRPPDAYMGVFLNDKSVKQQEVAKEGVIRFSDGQCIVARSE